MALALVVTIIAALVAAQLLRMVFPGKPSRLQGWLVDAIRTLADRVRGRRPDPPDPFEVLRLQTRLGALIGEIRAIEADPGVYAKAHRLAAMRAAYDDLLAEACELARVPVEPDKPHGDDVRWEEEQQLAERGWYW